MLGQVFSNKVIVTKSFTALSEDEHYTVFKVGSACTQEVKDSVGKEVMLTLKPPVLDEIDDKRYYLVLENQIIGEV
jgi:hypothetical protein